MYFCNQKKKSDLQNEIQFYASFYTGILEENKNSQDNRATTKAKYFYQSCMNMCKNTNI